MARYSSSEKKHSRSSGSFVTGHDESIGRGDRAGLPQEVMMKDYPPCDLYGDGDLDDTMERIDAENSGSISKAKKHLSKQH